MLRAFGSITSAVLLGFVLAGSHAAVADEVKVIEAPKVEDKNPPPDLDVVMAGIIEQTNAFRKAEDRTAVKRNAALNDAAAYFAEYMASTNRYGHTADDTEPADRASKYKYDHCLVSENIAYVFNSEGFTAEKMAEQFTTGWKNSPGHRKNMLDPDATETAVAVARSAKTGHYFAVQMFARPKSDAYTFSVQNGSTESFTYKVGDTEYSLEPAITRTHLTCRTPIVTYNVTADKKEGDTVKPVQRQKLVATKQTEMWTLK